MAPAPEPEPDWLAGLTAEADIKRALAQRGGQASPRQLGEEHARIAAGRELRRNLARIADVREEHERALRLYSQVKSGPNAALSQRRASALIAYEMDDPQKALQQLEEFGNNSPSHAIDMVLARAQLLASLEQGHEQPSLLPFDVIELDAENLASRTLISRNGPPMGAGTVALQHGHHVYIGSYVGDRIIKVPLN